MANRFARHGSILALSSVTSVRLLFLASCLSSGRLAVLASDGDGGTYLNVTGDILLGALFPVHGKGSTGQRCGAIQVEDGIQPLEAMLYALDQINGNPNVLPGVQLGALAFDTCDNPSHALSQALRFVKGFIAHENEFHTKEFRCRDRSVPTFLDGSFDEVVAVLGPQSSSVTIQVASVLALFSVPQISYMATSPFLSSKERFPHFFRTVPSDVNQARAMLEILRRFQWTYVSVVYSDTEYGDHGYETLTSLATEYSVCFSAPHRISEDLFSSEDYDNVVRTIAEKTDVRGDGARATKRVLSLKQRPRSRNERETLWDCSCSAVRGKVDDGARPRGSEESRSGLAIRLDRKRLVAGHGDASVGHRRRSGRGRRGRGESRRAGGSSGDSTALSPARGLRRVLYRPETRPRGCESVVSRILARLSRLPRRGGSDERVERNEREPGRLHGPDLENRGEERVQATKVSALRERRDLFGGVRSSRTAERQMRRESRRRLSGDAAHRRKSSFRLPGQCFLRRRGGQQVWLCQRRRRSAEILHPELPKGRGRFVSLDRRWQLHADENSSFPTSSCSRPCGHDRVMVRVKQDPCCWRCQSCGLYRYKLDEQRCEECERGTRPLANGTGCEAIPEEFVDYSNFWAVVAMTVAVCGMTLTAFVCSVFWLYRETPMIKASGRELSFVLLLGTFASFLMTFAIVAKPTVGTCALTRWGIGFCYTLCYAALATKTNRIHRIFNDPARSPRKRRYTSPKSQLAIAAILTTVEVLVDASWLIKVPPAVVHSYPTRELNVRVCRGSEDGSYVVGLAYPFVLTVACTFYAVKTRKCPEGFNETRRIAFANYATMILWLAFVPLYLASTSNGVRVVTLALSLSLNGLVQLLCLFFPKVYLVLAKPEKNTRELVMARYGTPSCPTTPATPEIHFGEAALAVSPFSSALP